MIFILGVATFVVPPILCRKWKLVVPKHIVLSYYVFLFASVILGELFHFYYLIPNWDAYLHVFSGGLLAVVGFSVLHLLYGEARTHFSTPPLLAAVFAFCFSLAMGAVWEIYEFVVDSIMDMNMQKFALPDGTDLPGRTALTDTMMDIVVDALGALVLSVLGYISLKNKKGWVEKLLVERG